MTIKCALVQKIAVFEPNELGEWTQLLRNSVLPTLLDILTWYDLGEKP
jgi:hypothetical protein